MKKNEIMNRISGGFNKATFKLKKHSPEILIVAGVVGTVVSAVMACKATMKINGILEKTKEDIDTIHDSIDDAESADGNTSEAAKKALAVVYVKTGVEFAKIYAPSVMLGALSITSILASNDILRKRNVALAAAYATVDKGFKEYRKRVIERFGEAVDREIKYNIKTKTFEEVTVDENGKEKKSKVTVNVADPNMPSEFARFFDESCAAWEKDPEYNLMFLRANQEYANNILKSRGHLFLNEVYDMLGIQRTKAGQAVGWVYDLSNPNIDNYVDFGIYNIDREKTRDFVNGYERSILLDFNVDGPIWDLI